MNIKWPPEETIKYEAIDPRKDKEKVVITAVQGGNPKKRNTTRTTDEGR